MSTEEFDRIVEDYLRRLDAALRGLPAGHRHQMIEEVRSHIAEGIARLDEATEADIRTLLEQLGSPEEIADASRAAEGSTARRSGGRRWPGLLAGIAAALAAAGLSAGLAVALSGGAPARRTPPPSNTTTTTAAVAVPMVVGESESSAAAVLSALGLDSAKAHESSVVAPKGVVVSQAPVAGAKVVPGSTVTLTVSSRPSSG